MAIVITNRKDVAFRFFEHPVNFVRELAYESKYVIETEEPILSAKEAVRVLELIILRPRASPDCAARGPDYAVSWLPNVSWAPPMTGGGSSPVWNVLMSNQGFGT